MGSSESHFFSRTMLIVGFQKRRLALSLFSSQAPQDCCLGVLINRTYCPTYSLLVSQLSKKAFNHMMALSVLKELRGVTIFKSLCLTKGLSVLIFAQFFLLPKSYLISLKTPYLPEQLQITPHIVLFCTFREAISLSHL